LGLPSGSLKAKEEWHPLLVSRIKTLLQDLENNYQLSVAANIGNKLAKTGLESSPLCEKEKMGNQKLNSIRTCTVHQVKGESIDGVMYIANKNQVRKLLNGTSTEVGRIGYVAVTRAGNLFILAVPEANYPLFRDDLAQQGFLEL